MLWRLLIMLIAHPPFLPLSLSPPAPLLRPRLPLKLSFAFSVWVCVHRTHNVIKINLYPNKQQKVNENCAIYADMAGQGEKCRTKNWTLRVSPRWLFALLSFSMFAQFNGNGPNAIMLALWHTHTTNSGSKYKMRNSMYVCVQIKYKDITILPSATTEWERNRNYNNNFIAWLDNASKQCLQKRK